MSQAANPERCRPKALATAAARPMTASSPLSKYLNGGSGFPPSTVLTIALAVAAGAVTARAGDNKDDEVAKAMSKIAQTGPGVYAVKKDDRGRIKSCVVVGQARISTVLGKAAGLEAADGVS